MDIKYYKNYGLWNIKNLLYYNMINFFVETKNEYTIQLVNLLTPLVYEGFQSIYTKALETSNCANNLLKVFQTFLKQIPSWNVDIIKNETERIMTTSKSSAWLPDLVKATLKANIIVLTYNPSIHNMQPKIHIDDYKNVKLDDFIHKLYIESARELWNNPYLMYHNYSPIELKRNQRDTILIIKESIREAIRKLLPTKKILEIYLGEELEQDIPINEHFDRNITEMDERNIQKLITKDLYDHRDEPNIQAGGNFNNEKKDLNTKILEIINETSENTSVNEKHKLSNSSSSSTNSKYSKTSTTNMSKFKNKSETIDKHDDKTDKYDDKIDNYHNKIDKKYEKIDKHDETIDNKIKDILEKELDATDLETSLSYRAETNEKNYQEIFTNNNGIQQTKIQNGGTMTNEKDTSKNKRRFFNNYLNI
jgi:hypothetical protein